MIEIDNLVKKFGNNEVLRGINLKIEKGERVALIGTSGSGKSTLLRCMNRLETPTSGDIYLHDKIINDKNIQDVRKKMGMVFQHFNLFNNLTVLDNLTLAPVELGMSRKQADRKAMELLKKIGLADKKFAYPSSLSGGQKQRVAIIRTLMMDPEVILFDEPTSALDPESIREVLDLIREVAKTGITMIIVTHEMGFAKEIGTRILFLDNGTIAEDATPEEFFGKPKAPRLKEFLKKVL